MRKIEKPWGYEEIWAETDKYVGKILTIYPGHRLSLQYHEKKEETIYVMSGILTIWHSENDADITHLQQGQTYHVKPGVIHRFGCLKYEDSQMSGPFLKIIEVSTPELDDVIRIKDDYKR